MTGWTGWRSAGREWLLARSLRQLVLGAGAVLLLVSGLFGGLARADDAGDLEPMTVGREVHLEPFDLTVEKAVWATDLGEPLGEAEGGRWLLVFGTVSTNQTAEVDAFVVKELLRVSGLEGFSERVPTFDDDVVPSEDAEPRVVVRDDQVDLGALHPGLEVEVAFIWKQSAAEPLPTELELVGFEHGFRTSSIDEQQNWFDLSEKAVATVPLTEYTP